MSFATRTGEVKVYTPYTGLSVLNFQGVNLTKDEIKEKFGVELKDEKNYDLRRSQFGDQQEERPCVFFFKDEDGGMIQLTLNISDQPQLTKNGNWQVITSNGSVLYAQGKDEFSNHRKLVHGEAELIALIQNLINHDRNVEDQDFYADMQEAKVTAEELFDGNYGGFDAFVGNTFVGLLTVRTKEDKEYQGVARNSQTWFPGSSVEAWMLSALKKREAKQQAAGYDLVKEYYTHKRQPFCLEDCVNAEPTNPVPAVATGASWN